MRKYENHKYCQVRSMETQELYTLRSLSYHVEVEPPLSSEEEIHCFYCNRLLQMFDIEAGIEGDEMWLFMLNDGEGGEAYACENCHNKYQ